MSRSLRVAPPKRGVFQLALALSLFPAVAFAAPFAPNDTSWEGTSDLLAVARARLGTTRVELVATLDWEALKPADGLLVLHPEADVDYDEASAFMRAGGRVALLDDFGKGSALLDHFQIKRIPAPLKPVRMLRSNPGYAVAIPSVQQVAGHEEGRHPIVKDVSEVVTNHASCLTHPNLTPVLDIPALGEPNATLAVTGVIAGRGRLFVMGDPSTLINLMLRYPGNRAFADGLLQYLVEDDSWGARGGKLYIVTGEFRQRGSYGGDAGLAGELREYLADVKQLLVDMHDDGIPGPVALLLAIGIAALGTVWIGRRTLKPYKRTSPRYAQDQPLVAQGGVAGRAAVLGAPSTHRALPLLEVKAALEEDLCHRMGLPAHTSPDRLLDVIRTRELLAPDSQQKLARLLMDLRQAELSVMAGQPMRVGAEEVQSARATAMALIAEVAERDKRQA
ncbi:MAG: DUF4350 domain-containing protein [Polyangiaceae bacterium]